MFVKGVFKGQPGSQGMLLWCRNDERMWRLFKCGVKGLVWACTRAAPIVQNVPLSAFPGCHAFSRLILRLFGSRCWLGFSPILTTENGRRLYENCTARNILYVCTSLVRKNYFSSDWGAARDRCAGRKIIVFCTWIFTVGDKGTDYCHTIYRKYENVTICIVELKNGVYNSKRKRSR